MKRITAKNGVVYYKSEILPCMNAFSTRTSGVSTLPHTSSLNLGIDRGDSIEAVRKNLFLFADAAGFEAESLISLRQIHSDTVIIAKQEDYGKEYFIKSDEACDAYVTDKSGIALGVRTADCVPLLFACIDESGGVNAVGAAHAGWRGTVAGIAVKTVQHLMFLGAVPRNIKVAIGPSIRKCCFEVREDFYTEVLSKIGKELTEEFVVRDSENSNVWHADIVGMNIRMLENFGILSENIDVSELCTCCNPKEFFSHRFSGGNRGTMLSVIKF